MPSQGLALTLGWRSHPQGTPYNEKQCFSPGAERVSESGNKAIAPCYNDSIKFIGPLLLVAALVITPAAHGEEWEILNEEVISLYEKGEYARATKVAKKALKVAEETLGVNHPDVATTLNNLAELYKTQGDYEAALPLYRRSLQIREEKLGKNHPNVATTLNNLAGYIRHKGLRSGVAVISPLLANTRRKTGKNHPDVATSLNNLAELYQTQGDYEAALPLYRRSLQYGKKNWAKTTLMWRQH